MTTNDWMVVWLVVVCILQAVHALWLMREYREMNRSRAKLVRIMLKGDDVVVLMREILSDANNNAHQTQQDGQGQKE